MYFACIISMRFVLELPKTSIQSKRHHQSADGCQHHSYSFVCSFVYNCVVSLVCVLSMRNIFVIFEPVCNQQDVINQQIVMVDSDICNVIISSFMYNLIASVFCTVCMKLSCNFGNWFEIKTALSVGRWI